MKIPFFFVFNSSVPPYLKCLGIVIFPFVFFAETREKTSATTVKHELTHVEQVRRHGVLLFYVLYHLYLLESYMRLGNYQDAYMDNPFEIEAYATEKFALTDSEIAEVKWTGHRSNGEERKAQRLLRKQELVSGATRFQPKRNATFLHHMS